MFNKLPRTHLRGFMICSPWSPAWLALHRCCWFWTLCRGGIRGGWRLEPASISSAWFPSNVPKRKRRRGDKTKAWLYCHRDLHSFTPHSFSPFKEKFLFLWDFTMGFFARLQNISPKPEVFVYVIPGFGILSICALIVQIITAEQFWKCPALFSLTMSLRHYLAVPQMFRYSCLTIIFFSEVLHVAFIGIVHPLLLWLHFP